MVEKNHLEDKNTDCFNRITANKSLYDEEFLKDWTEEKEDRKIFFLVISAYLHWKWVYEEEGERKKKKDEKDRDMSIENIGTYYLNPGGS